MRRSLRTEVPPPFLSGSRAAVLPELAPNGVDEMSQGFRTDIQALRGVAVSLVLLYHAGFDFFSAGFLGVDVFFVISGFLITDMVRKEVEAGRFSFVTFYFRRAKRLLPAAYVTFLLSALAAPFILNAQELQDFNKQVFGAVSFSANLVLLMQAGYFGGAADLKPLLHTWSLSIEEQYYLLLPAFVVFTPRKYWVAGAVVLFLASLGLCLTLLSIKPVATFYLLPTRGWELGMGSMIALMPGLMQRARPAVVVLFWPALAVLALIPVFPTGLPHPGLDALLVCLATAVVIVRRHPLTERALLFRGLARVGDVSYSLYLAHWPPFAFLKNATVSGVTPVQNLLTLLLGIVLGLLLYRFVEMPTRRWQLRPSRRFAFGTVAVSCCVVGVPVAMAAGFASGIDYAHVRRANDGFSGECVFETRFSPKPACQSAEKPAVLVWGDSFAMHLVPGVAAVSDRGVAQATRGNCAPVVGLAALSDVYYMRPWSEACIDFNDSVLEHVRREASIEVVVLSSPFRQLLTPEDPKHHWRTLTKREDGYVETEATVEVAVDALRRTVRSLTALGKRVVLVAPPPASGFNIGTCVERRAQGKLVLGAPRADCDIPLDDYRRRYDRTTRLLDALKGEKGVEVVSLDGLLCNGARCVSTLEGQLLYVDGAHLTHEGSVLLARKGGFEDILRAGRSAPAPR